MAAVALELQRLAQSAGDGSGITVSPAPRPARREVAFDDAATGSAAARPAAEPEPATAVLSSQPTAAPGEPAPAAAASADGPSEAQPSPPPVASADGASAPSGAATTGDANRSGRRSPGPLNRWTPGGSGSVWEPMEIVKTDYHSTPGVDVGGGGKRKGRAAAWPPGLWIVIAYAVLAIAATIVRHSHLH